MSEETMRRWDNENAPYPNIPEEEGISFFHILIFFVIAIALFLGIWFTSSFVIPYLKPYDKEILPSITEIYLPTSIENIRTWHKTKFYIDKHGYIMIDKESKFLKQYGMIKKEELRKTK